MKKKLKSGKPEIVEPGFAVYKRQRGSAGSFTKKEIPAKREIKEELSLKNTERKINSGMCLEQAVSNKNLKIEELETISEKNTQNLEEVVYKDEKINTLQNMLKKIEEEYTERIANWDPLARYSLEIIERSETKDKRIEELEMEVKRLGMVIREHECEVENLRNEIGLRNRKINLHQTKLNELNEVSEAKDERIKELELKLKKLSMEISELEVELLNLRIKNTQDMWENDIKIWSGGDLVEELKAQQWKQEKRAKDAEDGLKAVIRRKIQKIEELKLELENENLNVIEEENNKIQIENKLLILKRQYLCKSIENEVKIKELENKLAQKSEKQ